MNSSDLPQGTPITLSMETIMFVRAIVEKATNTKLDLFRKVNSNSAKGGIVFAGDSITEGYPLCEMFPRGLPLFNRGIGSLTAVQLLQNLDVHVLELAPSKLFLLVGTNDLGGNAAPEETAETIQKICEKTIQTCPETKIYLISVYPIDPSKQDNIVLPVPNGRTNKSILALNQLLQKAAQNMGRVTYLDAHSVLKNAEGKIKSSYTYDGLHLTFEGYQRVTEFLMPYVL